MLRYMANRNRVYSVSMHGGQGVGLDSLDTGWTGTRFRGLSYRVNRERV